MWRESNRRIRLDPFLPLFVQPAVEERWNPLRLWHDFRQGSIQPTLYDRRVLSLIEGESPTSSTLFTSRSVSFFI